MMTTLRTVNNEFIFYSIFCTTCSLGLFVSEPTQAEYVNASIEFQMKLPN